MKGIFLLLGTNLGDKRTNLTKATALLNNGEIFIVDYSSVYETAPWGNENQGWFLNMVVRVDTLLTAEKLLETCQEIELEMGRARIEKWGERIIDIDILYYDNLEINTENLTIPHSGIPARRFTLIPMVELAANETHPTFSKTQYELLDECKDMLDCRKTEIDLAI